MTRKPVGILTIASAANDDVTAWCLLAVVIAITKQERWEVLCIQFFLHLSI